MSFISVHSHIDRQAEPVVVSPRADRHNILRLSFRFSQGPPATSGPEFNAALAAAQAVAARLGGSGAPAAPPSEGRAEDRRKRKWDS
eukprot:scaffold138057_cov30-Prasinocladus_malaysianus.AAC.3